MKLKILISFFALAILSLFIFIYSIIGTTSLTAQFIRENIPSSLINTIKNTIFVFKNNEILDDRNTFLKFENERLNNKLSQINNLVPNLPNILGYIPVSKKKEIQFFNFDGFNYKLTKYNTGLLLASKHPYSTGNSYLEYANNNIYLSTSTGMFAYTELNSFDKNKFNLKIIKSNIKNLILYEDFYKSSSYGIKDLTIHKNYLYVSYSNESKKNCFNTAILRAKLNNEFLDFKKFFSPENCVSKINDYGEFNPHHSGGRIVPYGENKLFFSIGEYRYRTHAQSMKNLFGKIISIDINTKDIQILSIGNRNVQGMFFDKKNNRLFSTEHGPKGGDEINVNNLSIKEIKNYGWPISSYGIHYHSSSSKLKTAPLHKSHKNFGFIEPIKYWGKLSAGISEIVGVDNKFNNNTNLQLFFGTLGSSLYNNGNPDHRSIHQLIYDKNLTLKKHNIFKVQERIRDLIYLKDKQKLIMFMETTASIGILELLKTEKIKK